mmetsp:Transcript_2923/g.8962  ORF Transcript_2923/g.8962 Transcript_2923/m.8962 type:complete len:234 (-) Transcript_2923:828-1529(-)
MQASTRMFTEERSFVCCLWKLNSIHIDDLSGIHDVVGVESFLQGFHKFDCGRSVLRFKVRKLATSDTVFSCACTVFRNGPQNKAFVEFLCHLKFFLVLGIYQQEHVKISVSCMRDNGSHQRCASKVLLCFADHLAEARYRHTHVCCPDLRVWFQRICAPKRVLSDLPQLIPSLLIKSYVQLPSATLLRKLFDLLHLFRHLLLRFSHKLYHQQWLRMQHLARCSSYCFNHQLVQ